MVRILFCFPLISPIDAMNYENIIRYFPRNLERIILFLRYEDLVFNKKSFFKAWSNLLDINFTEIAKFIEDVYERKSITEFEFFIHKLSKKNETLSKILSHSLKSFFTKSPSVKIKISKKWEKKINLYFSRGNNVLNTELDLNLEEFNYPL